MEYNFAPEDYLNREIVDMAKSVTAVEKLLNYNFKDKKLLEEALTHPSYTGSASYQRLEFIGDSALGIAITNDVYSEYPGVDPGKLSLVRSANSSNEKLARVAIRHCLYKYVRRHNTSALDDTVMEFARAMQNEDDAEVHGGLIKAPKVLADIVESVAGAVYVDSRFNLKAMWKVIRELLQPIVTLDILEKQPVTMLFELCQKDGKQVYIEYRTDADGFKAIVYVDRHLIVSGYGKQKKNAKFHAAKTALQILYSDMIQPDNFSELNDEMEIQGATQKLQELCDKKITVTGRRMLSQ